MLGVLVCLFLSLSALDTFSDDKSVAQAITDFLIRVAPMVLLLGVLALSWRWE